MSMEVVGGALARMEAFGFQHDIELAILMFDDICLYARAACDDLGHENSL